jgi:WD40 repeat protein
MFARTIGCLMIAALASCTEQPAPELVMQHEAPVGHVAFSPDGAFFATVAGRESPRLWESATGRLVRVLPWANHTVIRQNAGGGTGMSEGELRDIAFSPDGKHLAALPMSLREPLNGGGWMWGAPAVWDVATARAVTVAPWTRRDAAPSKNPAVPWTSSEVISWPVVRDSASAHVLAQYVGAARMIASNARIGIAMEGETSVRTTAIVRLPDDSLLERVPASVSDGWLAAIAADGSTIAFRSPTEPAVTLWSRSPLRQIARFAVGPNEFVQTFAFSPDDSLLVVASHTTLRVFRVRDHTLLVNTRLQDSQGSGIGRLTFSRDSKLLAVAGSRFHMIELPSGRIRYSLGLTGSTTIGSWAANDSMLAIVQQPMGLGMSASADAALTLWPLTNGAPRRLSDSLFNPASLVFSPDGSKLALAAMENTIIGRYTSAFYGWLRVWDVTSGTSVLRTDTLDSKPVANVTFTDGGAALLAIQLSDVTPSRDCPYVECGENEFAEYTLDLDRFDLRAGVATTLSIVGEINENVTTTRFSPRGDRLVEHASDTVRLYETARGKSIPFRGSMLRMNAQEPFRACGLDQEALIPVEFNADGSLLANVGVTAVHVVNAKGDSVLASEMATSDTGQIVGARFGNAPRELLVVSCNPHGNGSSLQRLDVGTGVWREIARFPEAILAVIPLKNGGFLARSSELFFVHDKTGTRLASVFLRLDGEWIVATADGRWDASSGGADLAAWRIGNRLVTTGKLPKRSRVPGLFALVVTQATTP